MAKVASLVTPAKSTTVPRTVIVYGGQTKRDWPKTGSDFLGLDLHRISGIYSFCIFEICLAVSLWGSSA